ncbi:MAG: AEC family transporter [Eubacterium sp.]|nr:AEC family transporter [Eubacterium sp.]
MAGILIRKIAELFCYMFMGFFLVRAHILKKEDAAVLSKLAIHLIMPFSILGAFLVPFSLDVLKGIGIAIIAYAAIKAVVLPAASLYGKMTGANVVEITSIGYSNVGNLVLPIVGSVLGTEWMVYVVGAITVNHLFFWTHGIRYFSGDRKFHPKAFFLNMNIICLIAGFVIYICRIPMPGIAETAVTTVGSMIGPFSMLITGVVLGGMPLQDMFRNKRIFPVTAMRMLAMPMLAIILLKILRLDRFVTNGETILLIVLLSELTPSANLINQSAVLYHKDPEYASAIQIFSTLVSIVAIPLMVTVYQAII